MRGSLRLFLQFVFLLFITLTSRSAWSQDNILPLVAGEKPPALNSYIQYTKDFRGSIHKDGIRDANINYETIETPSIQFGITDQKLFIIFTVQNKGETQGEWILGTGRRSLKDFKLFEVQDHETEPLINSAETIAFNKNIRINFRIAHQFNLMPDESKTFAISYDPEQNNFFLPLTIESEEQFIHRQRRHNIIVLGAITGILVLIIVNSSFFVITGNKSFIWLSLAELFYGLQAIRTSGHFTYIYYLVDENYVHNQIIKQAIGIFVKTMFVVCMILFVKNFIQTKKTYPKFDKVLSAIALLAILTLALQMQLSITGQTKNLFVYNSNYFLVFLTSIILPIVAIKATTEININYWPLIVAWVVFAVYVSYGIVVTLNIIPSLPISSVLMAPIGLFEILFATLALGLQLRQLNKDKVETQIQLASVLRDNLQESEKARKSAEERSKALEVIHQQSDLIHASGHDSKQVITALNSAIFMLNQDEGVKNKSQLKDIIESSSSYLKQIVASTLSGAHMTIVGSEFTAISRFSSEDLFLPLEMLYKKQATNKNIKLSFEFSGQDYLISDLAILTRALSNFISNSMKFTKKGEIEICGKMKNDVYSITISDTGTGLSEDAIRQLNSSTINRYRESNHSSSTGSGFSSSKSLIEGLGGRVSIENSTKSGAIVSIELPKLVSHSPCDLDAFRSRLPHYIINKFDMSSPPENDIDRAARIAVTYDDSPIAREQMSSNHRFVLYEPLCDEFSELIILIDNLDKIEFNSSG